MQNSNQKGLTESIRKTVLLTSASALIIASLCFIVMEMYLTRQALVNRVSTMSELVANHVTAALSFDDKKTALKFLSSMGNDTDVDHVTILDENEKVFVEYRANKLFLQSHLGEDFPRIEGKDYHFTLTDLYFQHPIELDNSTIGSLRVCISLAGMWAQLAVYFLTVLTLILILILLIKRKAQTFKRHIAEPIELMLSKMSQVQEKGDYTVRIDLQRKDELGQIINQFNSMVEGIERRDKELVVKQAEIEKHAFFDPLTGLPNRRFLAEQLTREVNNAHRKHSVGAVFYIDLDNFKTINDSLGHDAGDALLKVIADRIRSNLRECDFCARIGGDEFLAVLPDIGVTEHAAVDNAFTTAEQLRIRLSQAVDIGERFVHSSASIGISLFNQLTGCSKELLKQSDMAMYAAKKVGRNSVHFFSKEMQEEAMHRLNSEEDLRHALEVPCEQFELYYQGQVNKTGVLLGAEALIRWHHPSGRMVSPGEFIPLAELTGLIVPLGKWVINTACKQLAQWQSSGLNLTLAVNVSPKQFLAEGFLDYVGSMLQIHAIDPRLLEIEITESLILDDKTKAIEIINNLKALGVSFSIDDFGTGYSSLQYLTALPISKLKIDQSFVRDISCDKNDAAIVKTIILMTQNLGLSVIAEGVETEEQHAFLIEHGCEQFQGYLFSKPEAIAQFKKRYLTSESCVVDV